MAVQSSYSRSFDAAFAGQPGDSGYKRDSSSTNSTGSAIPAGIGVCQATAAGELKLPDSATAKLLGIVLNTFARNPGDAAVSLSGTAAVADKASANLREQGAVYVVVEEAVTVADAVYMRHTANGAGKLQLGAFRNDLDGVAQVTTVTPAASQNTTLFTLRVTFPDAKDFEFTVVSDGSMTATEVCDALRVAMAADAVFTARVVATGTATLILTGQLAGEAFEVANDGTGTYTSITATTAAASTCRLVKGARFLTAAAAAGVAMLYIDIAVDRAFV